MMLDYQTRKSPAIDESNLQARIPIAEPTIALFHCIDLIDDFLDSIQISFETFCEEFIGSWMFGYINALKLAGVRTVLFCISAQVSEPTRFTHLPTGTTICVLPTTRVYRAYRSLRRTSLSMYGGEGAETFRGIQDSNTLRHYLLTPLKDIAKSIGTYLSTPLPLLIQELRREGCQAILCQEYEYARFDASVLLGRLINLPVFATFQGGDKTKSWLEVPWRWLAFHGCKGVIISTQSEVQRVCDRYSIPPTKIAKIYDPMDTQTWRPIDRAEARVALDIPGDAKVVVCHGRIDFYRKGFDILLEAWAQLCRDRPHQDMRLLLVGTGPDSDKLRQHIAAMQLRGIMWRDEFIHDRYLIRQYLSAANVYTLASRQEGFPIAPIEAMACGLPVVAADAPGGPDIFEGGEDAGGVVVPRGEPNALATAIGKVLDNQTLEIKLGETARKRVEQYFSPEGVGIQLRDFLLTH